MSKGQIIVLEGIDKAGKGTQCKLLQNDILKAGLNCKIMAFPDYSTNIGKEIRSFLDLKISYSKKNNELLRLIWVSGDEDSGPNVRFHKQGCQKLLIF